MFGCFTNTALAFNKTNKTIRSPGERDLRAPRSSAAAAGSQSSVSVCRAKVPSCHGPCRGRETDTGCASPSRMHKRETTNVCVTSTHNAKTSCHYLTFLRLYSCYDGKPEAGRQGGSAGSLVANGRKLLGVLHMAAERVERRQRGPWLIHAPRAIPAPQARQPIVQRRLLRLGAAPSHPVEEGRAGAP